MPVLNSPFSRQLRRRGLRFALLFSGTVLAAGCGGSGDVVVQTGTFGGTPVAGLNYQYGNAAASETNAAGQFRYATGEQVSFSIGKLALGSAQGAASLTPLTLTPGATAASDRRVTNKLILLQTLNTDGNLNNGIQIDAAARTAVSDAAASIVFDQDPTTFRAGLAPLLAKLNSAYVFTDLDPRPRSARTADATLGQFARESAVRHQVTISAGTLSGYEANPATWQYLGIPYAKPPVGDLRWRSPQPVDAWTGVRHAVAWSDQAAQNAALERFGEGGMSEDSLYLNVTAPKTATKAPVMVWFHGGGFTSLTSNTKPFNNPAALASKGVVQVSVNHRLGPFGYIAHPGLSQESGYNGSGNYGQMDLVMALQWVKANIAQFGGDPNNVTIFGESGGGRKVLSLMASPQAAGLFHKAISQSGTLIPDTRSLASAEAIGSTLQSRLGAASLAEMRARSWTDVVAAAAPLIPYTNVDNHYLPTTERVSFETRKHNDVPFLIVVNTNDTEDPIATVKNVFPWMSTHSEQNHYAALFSHMPAGWRARGVTTYHGGELTYVFNAPESVISHFLLNLVIDPATNARLVVGDLNGNGVTGSAGDAADVLASAGFDALDKTVIESTMSIWTQFAKTGNPSVPGLVNWPAYTTANDTYVDLGASPVVKTGLSKVFP
ncbi:MAG: carboxylesterase family protein [Gammaproteobacteria bacterium]|nr:carboxylesterase family protein [Gammaproteobacteria bacterium]MBU1816180.1 carboxylesterase family protein [Gammaproteobacteria bacterium]